MSVTSVVNISNRVLNFFAQIYALWHIYHHKPPVAPEQDVAGVWKYFVLWTSTAHVVFFGMAIITEIFSYLKFRTSNFSFRGFIFHGVVFPMGLSVFVSYWLLYISDRELISPKGTEKYIPPHINHIIHTLILPGILIESLTYFHPLPKRKDGLGLTWTVQLGYMGLVFYTGLTRNNWVYPFLGLLPMPLRIAFGVVTCLINSGYYLLGEKLHKLFWSKHLKEL